MEWLSAEVVANSESGQRQRCSSARTQRRQNRCKAWQRRKSTERQREEQKREWQRAIFTKMKYSTIQDLRWIAQLNSMRPLVKLFDPNTGCTTVPTDIPWPIVFVLSRFHKRFIATSNKIPGSGKVNESLKGFVCKMRTIKYSSPGDSMKFPFKVCYFGPK